MSHLINQFQTGYHACSIETLQQNSSFLCGTYELNEEDKIRNGDICAYSIKGDSISDKMGLNGGVLDMKVAKDRISVALSTGCLTVIKWENEDNMVKFTVDCSIACCDEGLFLSLDIDKRLSDDCWISPTNIIVSTQSGSIVIYSYNKSIEGVGSLRVGGELQAVHVAMDEPMPIWIVGFNPHSNSQLFSGGDDCSLKLWNFAQNNGDTSFDLIASNRKTHGAGVTSGQWHPYFKNVFATGSYDEHVRIWDFDHLQRPIVEIYTGGGVWRVKWIVPVESMPRIHLLVLACMHGGSRIVKLHSEISSSGECVFRKVNVVEHIDSSSTNHLAYGIDVLSCEPVIPVSIDTKVEDLQFELCLASCSFYDNLVQIWSCII